MKDYIDPRFEVAGAYISGQQQLIFRDIFRAIPKTVVAKRMGKKVEAFNDILRDPSLLRVHEIKEMAGLFGCPIDLVYWAVVRQMRADKIWSEIPRAATEFLAALPDALGHS